MPPLPGLRNGYLDHYSVYDGGRCRSLVNTDTISGSIGEVDYLIDDYKNLTVLPLEVKSGKDYEIHRALDRFLSIKDYGITDAVVLCNEREISRDRGITYMPVYYCMFYKLDFAETETIIPPMPIPRSM